MPILYSIYSKLFTASEGPATRILQKTPLYWHNKDGERVMWLNDSRVSYLTDAPGEAVALSESDRCS